MSNNKTENLRFFTPNTDNHLDVPLSRSGVSAGFPSPAEEFTDMSLDLNTELIRNPAATFFARVEGVSMVDDGIDDGDLLVIDKSITPTDGCLAVCFIDGEFTLKRVRFEKQHVELVPANKKYKPIRVPREGNFMVWGVVKYVIKKF